MELKGRKEVRELICVCERLLGLAHQSSGGLTDEVCELVIYYAAELEREVSMDSISVSPDRTMNEQPDDSTFCGQKSHLPLPFLIHPSYDRPMH
jgi:hypothetical protein